MMTSVLEPSTKGKEKETVLGSYLQGLLQQAQRQQPAIANDTLANLRQKSAEAVLSLRLPAKTDEDWRFSYPEALYAIDFAPADPVALSELDFSPFILPEAAGRYLTFVNGFYAPDRSDVTQLPAGVFVGTLADLPEKLRDRLGNYLGRSAGSNEVFAELNGAGLSDVAIVWAEPDAIASEPIHLLFLGVAGAAAVWTQPRILVVAERGSKLNVLEHYGAIAVNCTDIPQNQPYFTNVVSEICLDEGASLTHSRLQREAGGAFQIAHSRIYQQANSHYTGIDVNLGAHYSRHRWQVIQQGPQTETILNGLTAIAKRQLSDTHSEILLDHPYGTTNQLHKCIIDEYARAVFNGKVSVPQAAQMTQANQLNRNLLLSPKARIDTKPELQITADNVKCSHGATVSQLEADELFYLQSRGLADADARHLLIDAFAADILDRLPIPSLRQRLVQCVSCRTWD